MATLASILARLARLEKALNLDRTTGNWVIGLSGAIVWDPWDFPEPTADEAAATQARLIERMRRIRERLEESDPHQAPPTEAQLAEARRGLDEVVERYRAERNAVRDFTAKVERERAEREVAEREGESV